MAKEKFERNKPHCNIGTIGHVDHGKTTLTAAITMALAKASGGKAMAYADIDALPSEGDRALRPRALSSPSGLNRRPRPYQGRALPTELLPRLVQPTPCLFR